MSRVSRWVSLGTIVGSTLVLLVIGARWLEASAQQPVGMWGDPHVDLVLDTTETMAPELETLSQVWDDTDIVHLENATYGRFWYTDTVGMLPPTGDPAAVGTWLNSLQAEGGGACPDATLQALLAAGRVAADDGTPGDIQALLLSDSSPQGGRAALARTANRLLQYGLRVYPVQSGWCWGQSPLSMEAMKILGRMTGGTAWPATWPVTHGWGPTHTKMALNLMAAGDDLLMRRGAVSDEEADVYEFEIDSSVARLTLQVNNDTLGWTGCLTCPMPIPLPQEPISHCDPICPPLTATLRLPGGQIVGPGSPGVTFLETGYGMQIGLSPQGDSQLPSGTWQLRIEGDTTYDLRLAANTGIHISYLGRHSVPAGQEANVQVALLLPAVQGPEHERPPARDLVDGTLQSVFMPLGGGQPVQGGTLYDDGQHRDGAAGDGIFGGNVTLPPGAYRLVVRGELTDGTTLQRVDPSPIRARRFRLEPPRQRQATADSTIMRTFWLENNGSAAQSYELFVESSQGWALTDTIPVSVTLAAGETRMVQVPVQIPQGTSAGTVEETSLTAVGEDLLDSETATAETVVVDAFTIYLPVVQRD